MTVQVTSHQVDNAKRLLALDRAAGRESEEWVVRLAPATAVRAPGTADGSATVPSIAELDTRLRALEAEVARRRDAL